MRTREKAVLRAKENLDRAIERYTQKLEEALKALGKSCSHPVTEEWEWEHDDGYGRQSKVMGKRCKVCDLCNPWNRDYPGAWVRG